MAVINAGLALPALVALTRSLRFEMRFAFDHDGTGDSEDFDLDRDFPLGDGTADTSADVDCPYCGETNTVSVDPGSGGDQSYVEDCQVCCQPWRVSVHYRNDGTADVTATALDE